MPPKRHAPATSLIQHLLVSLICLLPACAHSGDRGAMPRADSTRDRPQDASGQEYHYRAAATAEQELEEAQTQLAITLIQQGLIVRHWLTETMPATIEEVVADHYIFFAPRADSGTALALVSFEEGEIPAPGTLGVRFVDGKVEFAKHVTSEEVEALAAAHPDPPALRDSESEVTITDPPENTGQSEVSVFATFSYTDFVTAHVSALFSRPEHALRPDAEVRDELLDYHSEAPDYSTSMLTLSYILVSDKKAVKRLFAMRQQLQHILADYFDLFGELPTEWETALAQLDLALIHGDTFDPAGQLPPESYAVRLSTAEQNSLALIELQPAWEFALEERYLVTREVDAAGVALVDLRDPTPAEWALWGTSEVPQPLVGILLPE